MPAFRSITFNPNCIMNWTVILIASLAATALMSAFSYIVSAAFGALFKEPVLLDWVLRKSGLKAGGRWHAALGWLLHFVFGLLFVLAYDVIWRWKGVTLPNTLALGAIGGIVGIAGWMLLFRIPRERPRIPLRQYYLQLFLAHVVFAGTAGAVYHFFGY